MHMQASKKMKPSSPSSSLAHAVAFRERLRAHERHMLQYWALRTAYLHERLHKMKK